jgi:hypothetical protein
LFWQPVSINSCRVEIRWELNLSSSASAKADFPTATGPEIAMM